MGSEDTKYNPHTGEHETVQSQDEELKYNPHKDEFEY